MALASNLPGPHPLKGQPKPGFSGPTRHQYHCNWCYAPYSVWILRMLICSTEICRRPDWRLWCRCLLFCLHDLDLVVEHHIYGTWVSPALLFKIKVDDEELHLGRISWAAGNFHSTSAELKLFKLSSSAPARCH
jgi:hypothetical protein